MFNKLNNENLFSYVLVGVLIFFVYAIVSSGKSEITAYAYHKLDTTLTDEGRVIALKLYQSHEPHMLTWHDYDSMLRPYMANKQASEPVDEKTSVLWLQKEGR